MAKRRKTKGQTEINIFLKQDIHILN
jgi:hypothetical protein